MSANYRESFGDIADHELPQEHIQSFERVWITVPCQYRLEPVDVEWSGGGNSRWITEVGLEDFE
jgi:hypothetical protein